MLLISAAEIAAIRAALELGGEFAATAEARRRWPALSVKQAQDCVRTITGWEPRAETQEQ